MLSGNQVTVLWPYGGPGAPYGAFAGKTEQPEPPPVADVEAFSGGFVLEFERELQRRRRKRKKLEEEAEEARALQDAVDREIAVLLKEQEAKDLECAEVERIRGLVAKFADRQAEEAFTERTRAAFLRAAAQQNASAILALMREMERQFEEEEFAVLMMLLDD